MRQAELVLLTFVPRNWHRDLISSLVTLSGPVDALTNIGRGRRFLENPHPTALAVVRPTDGDESSHREQDGENRYCQAAGLFRDRS
jgi:hypothetical protein